MDTTNPDLPVADILERMAHYLQDPRRDVVSQAFFFLEAIRKAGADQPDVKQVALMVATLPHTEAVLISIPDIALLHGIGSLAAKPEDGAILIFSDLSACWFDANGKLDEGEFCPRCRRHHLWR